MSEILENLELYVTLCLALFVGLLGICLVLFISSLPPCNG